MSGSAEPPLHQVVLTIESKTDTTITASVEGGTDYFVAGNRYIIPVISPEHSGAGGAGESKQPGS